jgi:hypothetical protein
MSVDPYKIGKVLPKIIKRFLLHPGVEFYGTTDVEQQGKCMKITIKRNISSISIARINYSHHFTYLGLFTRS